MNNFNNFLISKMNNIIHMKKILSVIVELLNGGFIIYGNFCRNMLNNNIDNEIDVYCTVQQYIYFGNISLHEMDDRTLCMEFVKYLKLILKNFNNVLVNITIKKNNYNRYIACHYDNIKINIYFNDDGINYNLLCNVVRIEKINNEKNLTVDDFSEFMVMNGFSNKLKFTIGNIQNISIMNVIESVKMKMAICFYKYKKYNEKIIFDQTFMCDKKSTCKENPSICNKKYNNINCNNINCNTIYKNNCERGLCPCEMNIFMMEFEQINKKGYVIVLGYHLKNKYDDVLWLKINYKDVLWPSSNNNNNKIYNSIGIFSSYYQMYEKRTHMKKENDIIINNLSKSEYAIDNKQSSNVSKLEIFKSTHLDKKLSCNNNYNDKNSNSIPKECNYSSMNFMSREMEVGNNDSKHVSNLKNVDSYDSLSSSSPYVFSDNILNDEYNGICFQNELLTPLVIPLDGNNY